MESQLFLKIKFDCFYNYQRALCEDPTMIFGWFKLLRNMMAKYKIQKEDLYNFNKTGFIID